MNHDAYARGPVVNAADYGYTAGVSEGILSAHGQGIASSTSSMMTKPPALDAPERPAKL